jgi:hypothetical protein
VIARSAEGLAEVRQLALLREAPAPSSRPIASRCVMRPGEDGVLPRRLSPRSRRAGASLENQAKPIMMRLLILCKRLVLLQQEPPPRVEARREAGPQAAGQQQGGPEHSPITPCGFSESVCWLVISVRVSSPGKRSLRELNRIAGVGGNEVQEQPKPESAWLATASHNSCGICVDPWLVVSVRCRRRVQWRSRAARANFNS